MGKRGGAVLAAVLLVVFGAPVVAVEMEIHGNFIAEYQDAEFGHPLYGPDDANNRIRFTQAQLILQPRFSEILQGMARVSLLPDTLAVTEAWLALDGLGPGRLTFGQFYRPRGAPIPTLNLSLPTLIFRSFSTIGIKYSGEMEDQQVRYEFGVTNRNPLSLSGTSIANVLAISRPSIAPFSADPPEIYLSLGSGAGGAWGTVEVNMTGTYGTLSDEDVRTIANSGMYFINQNDRNRRVIEGSVDYIYGPVRFYGDGVFADEGDLEHEAWEVGIRGKIRSNLSLLGSFGQYRVNADVVDFDRPWSWDRIARRIGVTWQANPVLQIQAEYDFNSVNALYPDGRKVKDDVFAIQALTAW